jgi:hypothetical protein
MISRLHHQFKLAAPILGPLSILVFALSLWSVLATKQVGDGIDELTANLAVPKQVMDAWIAGHWIPIAGIALLVTTIMAMSALQRIHGRRRLIHVERIAFWSGVLVVPMAYLVAPAVISLPLVLIFGFAALAIHGP